MATETRFDKSTVSVGGVGEDKVDCPPNSASTWYVPILFPIASPLREVMNGPEGENDQLAKSVTSCWDVSLKVALALYCCWFTKPMVTIAGLTAREDRVAPVIFSCALFERLPEDALITTEPGDIPIARPWVGELLLTVAVLGSRQDHCAVAVKSFVLPSE